jgi:SAM-dependent methyltransferase
VDENPYLLAWVAGNLHSVEPRVASWPPLEFEADTFDVVLAVDTLTHFDQDLTFAWMQELVRVTKPGGVIVLTLNGEEGLARLAPELREAFAAGRQVVERPELAGTLACVAHHPAAFVDEVLARGLELLERVPGGEGSAEGLVLLRRPA